MKPLKVAWWVVGQDLQAIYDYHHSHSPNKADRVLAEYDRIIALLEINPLLIHPAGSIIGVFTRSIVAGNYFIILKRRRFGW